VHYYNDLFYGKNIFDDSRYISAKEMLAVYFDIFDAKKIVDVGCGRGAWLEATKAHSSEYLVGIDGDWNNNKISKDIQFIPLDLNNFSTQFVQEKKLENKFDLCISAETLEHIENKNSKKFIEGLCNLSDNVLFSAAFNNQGGINHINENLHSNWAKIFIENKFYPFDIFRPNVWDNEKISYWYRQNTFLYVKEGSLKHSQIKSKHSRIKNISFMDCIHPMMYEKKINKPIGEILKELFIKTKKKFTS